MLHIVCCSDQNFLMHTAVMLVSLFENNRDSRFMVHLIGRDIDDEGLSKLKKTIESTGNSFCFYPFGSDVIDSMPHAKHTHISNTTYCRLYIADILPKNVDKVLYLDGDIIVIESIKQLMDIDLGDNMIGAVPDVRQESNYKRLCLPTEHDYFNAGVLLINLKAWREERLAIQVETFLSKSECPQLDFADQDILNVFCQGRVKPLPYRYNLQDAIVREKVPNANAEFYKIIDNEIKHGKIVHFSCHKKPWQVRCVHPLKYLYKTFLQKTEWKSEKICTYNLKDMIFMAAYHTARILRLTNSYNKRLKEL